jgi:hypothetical protein
VLAAHWTLMNLYPICFFPALLHKLGIVVVETDPFLALEEIKTQLNLPFLMDIIILFLLECLDAEK